MHTYFRKFTIVNFLVLAIIFFASVSLHRYAINQQIVHSAQRESAAFIHVLENAIRQSPELSNNLFTSDSQKFRNGPEYIALKKLVYDSSRGTELLRFNLYDPKGETIYSSAPSQLDMNVSTLPSFKRAVGGVTASESVSLKNFYDINGVTQNREAVSMLAPISMNDRSGVDAVAHVYTDISGHKSPLSKPFDIEYMYAVAMLLLLYAILYQFIRRANKYAYEYEVRIVCQNNEIERYACQDVLTELPNRFLFLDRLEHAMQRIAQQEKLLAVLSLDLNRFKCVNDKYGLIAGDTILVEVSERLKRCVRGSNTVSRLHGGNFAVIIEDMSVVDEASEAASQILDVLYEPFEVDGQNIVITSSMGVAIYPFDNDGPESLLLKADSALSQAKEAGRNTYQFYNSDQRNKAVTRFSLENDLRQAFERNEFQIYYQPIVKIDSGEITGVEALLRWHSPTRGIIPPMEFISVLEDSGLIISVGELVLESACIQGKEWKEKGFGELKINVNISARQFNDNSLLQAVENALSVSGLPPHQLNLEITESLLLESRDRVLTMLDKLLERGVSISVDDFGTGYSSMTYLKNMPIETIKIDKTFVHGLPTDMDDVAIIHAIDYLSKSLRLNVIAEGVETVEQLEFLARLNVRTIQGYLVSRPLPAIELELLFQQHDPEKFRRQAESHPLRVNGRSS